MFLFEDKKEISIPGREVRYRIERYAASAGVEKQLTDKLKAEFYYEYSIVRTTDVQPDVVLSKEERRYPCYQFPQAFAGIRHT